jgi:serine/threonine-protein kinase HipA
MDAKKCLYCYKELDSHDLGDFHAACSKKIFGSVFPPEIDFSISEITHLADNMVRRREALSGVQPKLSLSIEKNAKPSLISRFTIVSILSGYILKPPSPQYRFLPETEDLTMHLAGLCGIQTVPHSLIRLKSGELAYITKRIDRKKKTKVHMEDMCQLTERLTEHKYQGSYEQIGRVILKYSVNPYFDIFNYYRQVVFSFLTGNADMHLKNFSLINQPGSGYALAPAYDLVSSKLLMPEDPEELALTLNGKKGKLKREDFLGAFSKSGLDKKGAEDIFGKFEKALPLLMDFIEKSFLNEGMKEDYSGLLIENFKRLNLSI